MFESYQWIISYISGSCFSPTLPCCFYWSVHSGWNNWVWKVMYNSTGMEAERNSESTKMAVVLEVHILLTFQTILVADDTHMSVINVETQMLATCVITRHMWRAVLIYVKEPVSDSVYLFNFMYIYSPCMPFIHFFLCSLVLNSYNLYI